MRALPPLLAQWASTVEFEPLTPPVRDSWSRFNPSIVRVEDTTTIAVRSANYRLTAEGRYEFEGGAIRSETILVDLVDGGLANPRPLPIDTTRTPSSFPVCGWEDVRVFSHDGALHALATVRDVDDTGLCRIALLVPAGAERVSEVLLHSPRPGRHEKNWVPWPTPGLIRAVYSWDPLRIALIDASTGAVELQEFGPSGLGATTRGSSGAVALSDDEALFIVHESHSIGTHRVYLHRFVTLGSDGTVMRASERVRLAGLGVEYVAGAARVDDALLITFGVNDREAWLARLPLTDVLDRLVPAPRIARMSA